MNDAPSIVVYISLKAGVLFVCLNDTMGGFMKHHNNLTKNGILSGQSSLTEF